MRKLRRVIKKQHLNCKTDCSKNETARSNLDLTLYQTKVDMPLFEVEVSIIFPIIVSADSCEKAKAVARRNISAELENLIIEDDASLVARKVESLSSIPSNWVDCMPYGDNPSEKTCKEFWESGEA